MSVFAVVLENQELVHPNTQSTYFFCCDSYKSLDSSSIS